jgi:hypothetical protein
MLAGKLYVSGFFGTYACSLLLLRVKVIRANVDDDSVPTLQQTDSSLARCWPRVFDWGAKVDGTHGLYPCPGPGHNQFPRNSV